MVNDVDGERRSSVLLHWAVFAMMVVLSAGVFAASLWMLPGDDVVYIPEDDPHARPPATDDQRPTAPAPKAELLED